MFLIITRNIIREDNGTPLQYSCLENPMDGGAWWAAVHGVAKSRTQLSNFTFTHWRRQWHPTPVLLPGESQGWGSLVGCHLWGRTELGMTEATQQQQQQEYYHTLSSVDIITFYSFCLSVREECLILIFISKYFFMAICSCYVNFVSFIAHFPLGCLLSILQGMGGSLYIKGIQLLVYMLQIFLMFYL